LIVSEKYKRFKKIKKSFNYHFNLTKLCLSSLQMKFLFKSINLIFSYDDYFGKTNLNRQEAHKNVMPLRFQVKIITRTTNNCRFFFYVLVFYGKIKARPKLDAGVSQSGICQVARGYSFWVRNELLEVNCPMG